MLCYLLVSLLLFPSPAITRRILCEVRLLSWSLWRTYNTRRRLRESGRITA